MYNTKNLNDDLLRFYRTLKLKSHFTEKMMKQQNKTSALKNQLGVHHTLIQMSPLL